MLIFNEFGFKMHIQSPKCLFWGLYPVNGEQTDRDPQRAPSCIETCHTTYRSLRSVQLFLRSSRFYPTPKILCFAMGQWVRNSPKSALATGVSGPPSNMWLGPHEFSTQTASWSVEPFLQGSCTTMWQTGRPPTDHATQSITTGRIYVRSTAMRPEKAKGLKTKTDLLSRYGARKSPRSQSRGRKRVYGALEGFAKQVRF